MKTDQEILDCFCTLALESNGSDQQLTHYARIVLEDSANIGHPDSLVADLKDMPATEYMARVKRWRNGSATGTSNHGMLPRLRSERKAG